MKPSRFAGFQTRWPLIEEDMNRGGCMAWLRRNGFDVPRKSACWFCPFHGDRAWLDLKRTAPEVFVQACDFDERMRSQGLSGVRGAAFLHKSLRPLREVDLGEAQTEFFGEGWGNECEGRCGI